VGAVQADQVDYGRGEQRPERDCADRERVEDPEDARDQVRRKCTLQGGDRDDIHHQRPGAAHDLEHERTAGA
jgi:hypothetical protein